jgi:predicted nucleotidyltransferase
LAAGRGIGKSLGTFRFLVDSFTAMNPGLARVLQTLREHQEELRNLGVRHASVFGSVARGENRPDSDVDVLIELDREHAMGLFEYSRLKLQIAGLIGTSADVVNRNALKPLLRENILNEAVDAF